jgi:molybdate transport system ATP-binding protein
MFGKCALYRQGQLQGIDSMSLAVKIRKRIGHIEIDVAFSCEKGQVLVLIGPSGAGKTSIVRTIAGLEKPDAGRISYNGETWVDTESGVFYPPRKRHLGYVFQDYPLFPHLSIYRNAAFAAGESLYVEDLLRLFGISHLRNRKPDQVSGGERQRCAICQALARRPQALLLDEPFSALDAITRRSLRDIILGLKSELKIPIVYVTHDITEALSTADEIIPVVEGKMDENWIHQPYKTTDDDDEEMRLPAAWQKRLSTEF